MTPSSLGQFSFFYRPGDDADVGDAGLFDRVHDGGEGTEGHLLIGAYVGCAWRDRC